MRIAVDVAAAINQRAGIGRYARGILDALARRHDPDWVLQIAPRPNDAAAQEWRSRFRYGRLVELPVTERYLWAAWQRLRLPLVPDLLARGLDVFYNPDFVLPPLAYAPGVCTVHDLGFMIVPQCSFPRLRELLLRAVPRSLEQASAIVAVSAHTRRDLITLLGVPARRIYVAGNAPDALFRPIADPAWRAGERARLAARLGTDLQEPFLLTVGTLEPRKNLVVLLDALAILRDRGRRILLVVVGREGWLFEPIYERVERHGLRSSVRFMRDGCDRDLLALYNLAAAMVFPSLYEGFGVPPLEALACGAVVVCSTSSSLPEVVGDAALPVSPYDERALADALERALDDEVLRAELRERGPCRARQFTWDAAAESVRTALRAAAGGPHPPTPSP